eukprot:TRINITY_DN95324_c0_g1_i1.p1 TRINITY_DN95324_c0_g1~~TRINITY_DN95324_c0_g1_i1.p1  ORF type:complete len:744 (+),score=141.55 TRINITY_DN95324_c0_g1_i1:41-2233(+)
MGCGASAPHDRKYEASPEGATAVASAAGKSLETTDGSRTVASKPTNTMTQSIDSQISAQLPAAKEDQLPLLLPKSSEDNSSHAQGISNPEDEPVRAMLIQALKLRQKWQSIGIAFSEGTEPSSPQVSGTAGKAMVMVDGVAEIPRLGLPALPCRHDFKKDLTELWKIIKDPECKSTSMARLERLSLSFKHYDLENKSAERNEAAALKADIHTVMKVDNHIHLAAAMTPRMLLKFIKDKLKSEPDREVVKGKTLRQVLVEAVANPTAGPWQSQGLKGEETPAELDSKIDSCLTVDSLRTVADDHFYHRFDNFNDAYSPLGCADLRTIFLKHSNHIKGEYFAQLSQTIIDSYEKNDTYSEMRVSIYGKNLSEWDSLANWIKKFNLHSPAAVKRNLWMVQIPRIFGAFRKGGLLQNFEELLNNIFQPLFEAALDPESHPVLAEVLPFIIGIDSVDDESFHDPLTARRSQLYSEEATEDSGTGKRKIDPSDTGDVLRPQLWTVGENPPYSYYLFYTFINIKRFNDLCKKLGRPWHFTFRPHAGEAGPMHHLATTFLLADGINHGVNLQHSPALQYLYGISQIGVSVSPLSNNSLFLKVAANPFPDFFQRGLNVTLSTDDPLMFHTTKEPLLEEYTIAKQVFDMSMTDMCEIAANSVRQSSFGPPGASQGRVLGVNTNWVLDPAVCNIPQRRLSYRQRSMCKELHFLKYGLQPVKEMSLMESSFHWMMLEVPMTK